MKNSSELKVGDICTLNRNPTRAGKGIVYRIESVKENPHFVPGLFTLRPVFGFFLDVSKYPRIFDASPDECQHVDGDSATLVALNFDDFIREYLCGGGKYVDP